MGGQGENVVRNNSNVSVRQRLQQWIWVASSLPVHRQSSAVPLSRGKIVQSGAAPPWFALFFLSLRLQLETETSATGA